MLWPQKLQTETESGPDFIFATLGNCLAKTANFRFRIQKEARTMDDESLGRLITCKGA
jgi:hypothetical protein